MRRGVWNDWLRGMMWFTAPEAWWRVQDLREITERVRRRCVVLEFYRRDDIALARHRAHWKVRKDHRRAA